MRLDHRVGNGVAANAAPALSANGAACCVETHRLRDLIGERLAPCCDSRRHAPRRDHDTPVHAIEPDVDVRIAKERMRTPRSGISS
jgi:hypothetical protein